jgi:hypothetical protein
MSGMSGIDVYDYEEFPKRFARDDFWRQVGRTVNGEPLSDDHIAMIVASIRDGLDLDANDAVLDLACGNGALSREFFSSCKSLHGCDRASYLIDVAHEFFRSEPNYLFTCDDVGHFVANAPNPEDFTKCYCYGSFALFPRDLSALVLKSLNERYTRLQRVYIGTIPDLSKAEGFYQVRGLKASDQDLDDPNTPIGIWWTKEQISELASDCGWTATLVDIPEGLDASRYRFDAVLTRKIG